MKKNQLELLAPAGSYDIFRAVLNAGADAVYVGGGQFGARAYANNFSEEELLRAIDEAHIHGKQLYLTVNTLLKEEELEAQLYDYLRPYYEQGLDAVIVQDTICWWHQEASDLFNMFSKVSGVPDMTQHVVLLCDYIYGYLAGQEASVGSPYKICAARNIATPSPAHCSANDVATMQLLAQGIGFEQKPVLEPPKRWSNDAMAQKGSSAYKLLYDPQAKLLHQSDCKLLPDNRHFPAFLTFKLPIRRKYKPCSCCRDEFLDALWDRNQDSVARSEYNYVYSKQSKIFHTRKCSHVLLAYDIQGTVSYDTCLKSGRRPCKHCNPEPIEHKTIAFPVLPKKPQSPQERSLSKDEQSAIGRFNRAKQEREAAFKRGSLSDAEKSNIMALSQPGLAFWASRGYRTFHRRNCPQITGLNQLVGFPRYQDGTAHAGIVSQVRSKMSSIRSLSPTKSVREKVSKPWYNSVRNIACRFTTTIDTSRCRRWLASGKLIWTCGQSDWNT